MRKISFLIAIPLLLSACGGGSSRDAESSSAGMNERETATVQQDPESLPGHALYEEHCLPCHQEDGKGVPGMFPPLINTDFVNGEKEKLVRIITEGLDQEIEINGEVFDTPMAPLPHLTDREIADILTFVRAKFGSVTTEVTESEVRAIRGEG